MYNLTPIQSFNGVFFKRDDFFKIGDVCGGKVRTAEYLCSKATKGIVTAGSRHSPQIKIISELAFIAVTSLGEETKEILFAKKNGAEIRQINMGFNNNIIKKAKNISLDYDYKTFA